MNSKQLVKAIVFAAGICGGVGHAATVVVDMVPGGAVDNALARAPGDAFDVSVLVSDALDLAGFQFDLTFNSAVLQATLIGSGGIFDPDTFAAANSIDQPNGLLSFAETTLGNGVDASLPSLLATIHFTVLAEGFSPLTLGNVILADSNGDSIVPVGTLDGGLTSKNVVPPVGVVEPGVLPLMGCGILAALLLGRRQRAVAPRALA